MHLKHYQAGDIVWAQAIDEPIWPSRIGKVVAEDLYKVFFLNDVHHALMRSEHLQDYKEHRQSNLNADDTDKFWKAVRMADGLARKKIKRKGMKGQKKQRKHSSVQEDPKQFRAVKPGLRVLKGKDYARQDYRDERSMDGVDNGLQFSSESSSEEIVEVPVVEKGKHKISNYRPPTIYSELGELKSIDRKIDVLARLSSTDGQPTTQAVSQLKTLRNKINDLAERMLLNKALGSISDVLDVLSAGSKCVKPLETIRGELLSVKERLGDHCTKQQKQKVEEQRDQPEQKAIWRDYTLDELS